MQKIFAITFTIGGRWYRYSELARKSQTKTAELVKTSKANTKTKIPSFEGIIADMDHNRYHHIENQ